MSARPNPRRNWMCWGPRFGCEDASTEFHGSFTKYRCRAGKYIPNLLVRIRFRACNLKKVEVAIVWSTTKELVGFYLRACGLKSQRKIDFCAKFVPRAGRAFRRG